MDSLYQQLSGHAHAGVQSGDVITISEEVINRQQMATLACVCEHCSISYAMHYIVEPDLLTS